MAEQKQKPNRRPFFRFIKSIMRIFKRKPKFKYLGEKPKNPCIYISNHSAASGPVTYELYLPANMRMWGTYEMCGGFRMRWRYLKNVYFRKKKKRTKLGSFLLATVVCPFMALFYKGMRILPTYPDARLATTVKKSIAEMENGISMLIFPENSDDGYHEVLKEFHCGFFALAKLYYERTGKDIDIVDMYYHRRANVVIVGEPRSYTSLAERFDSREQVAEFFLNDVNDMFFEHVNPMLKHPRKREELSLDMDDQETVQSNS